MTWNRPKIGGDLQSILNLYQNFFITKTQKLMISFKKKYPPPPNKKGLFFWGGGYKFHASIILRWLGLSLYSKLPLHLFSFIPNFCLGWGQFSVPCPGTRTYCYITVNVTSKLFLEGGKNDIFSPCHIFVFWIFPLNDENSKKLMYHVKCNGFIECHFFVQPIVSSMLRSRSGESCIFENSKK